MNIYRSFRRWYVQLDWADPVNGHRFAIGRHAELITDQYAADDVPHPFGDMDALAGNITSPIGAQSFRAIKEAHENSPQAYEAHPGAHSCGPWAEAEIHLARNWVSQEDGS